MASEADVRVEYITRNCGFGVKANRLFAAGELILCEEPLLSVPREFSLPLGMDEETALLRTHSLLDECLLESLEHLTASASDKFFGLACHQADCGRSALGIFRTNAIETGARGTVFALSSRLNHSCDPNVIHRWNSASEVLELRAARDIPMDAELFIAYRAQGLPRAERRRQLWVEFGFVCECNLCSPTESE